MQRRRGVFGIFRLADDATAHGHDGVGAENIGVFPRLLALERGMRRFGLLQRQTTTQRARMLELRRRLVDIHRHQACRLDADLMQQFQTPR